MDMMADADICRVLAPAMGAEIEYEEDDGQLWVFALGYEGHQQLRMVPLLQDTADDDVVEIKEGATARMSLPKNKRVGAGVREASAGKSRAKAQKGEGGKRVQTPTGKVKGRVGRTKGKGKRARKDEDEDEEEQAEREEESEREGGGTAKGRPRQHDLPSEAWIAGSGHGVIHQHDWGHGGGHCARLPAVGNRARRMRRAPLLKGCRGTCVAVFFVLSMLVACVFTVCVCTCTGTGTRCGRRTNKSSASTLHLRRTSPIVLQAGIQRAWPAGTKGSPSSRWASRWRRGLRQRR